MISLLMNFLLKIASSKAAEELVTASVQKLVDSADSGISKSLAGTMIRGISKSELNLLEEDDADLIIKIL